MVELLKEKFPGYQLVLSPERDKRPRVRESAKCPFCPGHEALTPATRARFPETDKWQIRSFENKYPVFPSTEKNPLGYQEVVVETPDHEQRPQSYAEDHFLALLRFVRQRMETISRESGGCRYITWFKNEGRLAGATVSHAHSQIVRLNFLPETLAKAYRRVRYAADRESGCPLCEKSHAEKALLEDKHYKLIVNPAGRLPFEMLIIPAVHVSHFEKTDEQSLEHLAGVLRKAIGALTKAKPDVHYNILLQNGLYHKNWNFHWHIAIIPRLAQFAGLELATGLHIMPMAPQESFAVLKKHLMR